VVPGRDGAASFFGRLVIGGCSGALRVKLVVLAAARLRAFHLDPLVTGSRAQRGDQPRRT
jgi:hypothetical protein